MTATQPSTPLRIVTCGSVDDGKSTLLGRLLYDTQHVFEDQLEVAEEESRRWGTQARELDLALLVDGLQAEREQKITIDVAYRYFSTANRSFIVADAPGHEQYTCNMATGASTASLALLLVDARNGVVDQTRRHTCILELLAIRHIVVAVNKMDLVGWTESAFEAISCDYLDYTSSLNFESVTTIPVSALDGDNISDTSENSKWYMGPTLIQALESAHVEGSQRKEPFRMPVQWINRPTPDFRGYSGTIASGEVRVGDEVVGCLSGITARVSSLMNADQEVASAIAGNAVTLQLDEHMELGRGDVIATSKARPEVSDQFATKLIWLGAEPMLPQRQYWMKIGTQTTSVRVLTLDYVIDISTLAHEASTKLELNQIARVKISVAKSVVFEPFHVNTNLGSFILMDRITNETVGAGMIEFSLRRASNIPWQPFQVDKVQRGRSLGQKPCILWFTGLSGAGKSTIAGCLEEELVRRGCHCYILDGDNIRHGLSKDLGFTDADRVANIKRVAEVAKLFLDAGLITIVCLISPFRNERLMARELVEPSEFIEVFVDTPLDVCEARDPKGLYKKARSGDLINFTGVDSPYESPLNPEIVLKTDKSSQDQLAKEVIAFLDTNHYLAS